VLKLPVSSIAIEVANFDIQKMMDPDISGVDYRDGVQKDFWNLREYILHRDGHNCQNPDGKNHGKGLDPSGPPCRILAEG
jgi:hypothetical protein